MSSSLSAIPGLVPLPVFIEEAQPHPSDATWAEISPSVVLCTEEEFEAAVAPCELPAGWQRSEAYLLDLSNGAAQVSAISELGLSRGLRVMTRVGVLRFHSSLNSSSVHLIARSGEKKADTTASRTTKRWSKKRARG